METKECAVCCEVFNKSNRKRVECKCEYDACRVCTRRYLLNVIHEPHCMNCKAPWDRKQMVENLGVAWVARDYKTHRENVLFAKEQSLMPAAQAELENRTRLAELERMLDEAEPALRQARRSLHRKRLMLELLQREIANEEVEVQEKEAQLHEINTEVDKLRVSSASQKKAFVRRCTHPGCRGFLSTALKCGICEMWSCGACREVKGPERDSEHKCDPNTVETVKLLEKDTKPCPKCACMIFKISGCDQMWCPECQTAFSWKSGKVETGFMHNPHYLEYRKKMRDEGKDASAGAGADAGADADADAVLERPQLRRGDDRRCAVFDEDMILYASRHWPRNHALSATGLPDIQYAIRFLTQGMNRNNLELRINYLTNGLTEKAFKQKIQQNEKKTTKRRWELDIFRMYLQAMTDLLFRRMDDELHATEIFEEMKALREYTNEQLRDVAKLFNNSALSINPEFRFTY
jgi:hypothetical protein